MIHIELARDITRFDTLLLLGSVFLMCENSFGNRSWFEPLDISWSIFKLRWAKMYLKMYLTKSIMFLWWTLVTLHLEYSDFPPLGVGCIAIFLDFFQHRLFWYNSMLHKNSAIWAFGNGLWGGRKIFKKFTSIFPAFCPTIA